MRVRLPVLIVTCCLGLHAALISEAGAWSSKWTPITSTVHQDAIDRALPSLPSEVRQILKDQQSAVDRDQDTKQSFEHAMAGGAPGTTATPSLQWWIDRANDFVRVELDGAMAASPVDDDKCSLHKASDNAYCHLGRALHALMDATSPAHRRFQLWDQGESIWLKLRHVMQERSYPDAGGKERAQLQGVILYAYDIFQRKVPMPESFFASPDGALRLPDSYSK